MEFSCWECGACCKLVGLSVENAKAVPKDERTNLIEEVASFPFRYDLSGRCSKLGLDNRCEVYDNRPSICNAKLVYRTHRAYLTWEEYSKLAEEACKQLDSIMEGF